MVEQEDPRAGFENFTTYGQTNPFNDLDANHLKTEIKILDTIMWRIMDRLVIWVMKIQGNTSFSDLKNFSLDDFNVTDLF